MTKFTEGRHPGEFLMSEANGFRSRQAVTIKSGAGVIKPGAILGKLTVGAATSAVKAGGNTGTGTLTLDATTPVLHGAVPGVYQVRFVQAAANAGEYEVTDPSGNLIGVANVGQTFANRLKFAIADGGADFAVGDGFDITVAVGSTKYAPSPDTITAGLEGAEVATAVALYGADATSADAEITAIVLDAEVNAGALEFDASVSTDAKKATKLAQLAAVGIIAR